MGARLQLSGQRFGRLLAVRGLRAARDGKMIWLFHCECGSEKEILADYVRTGKVRSCGCLRRENSARLGRENRGRSYGGVRRERHPLWAVWMTMKARCTNPNSQKFPIYGGRGIKVCARWIVGEGKLHPFDCFVADMGERPTPSHSIDRINVDGDYEPENCRWATPSEQARNKRPRREAAKPDGRQP